MWDVGCGDDCQFSADDGLQAGLARRFVKPWGAVHAVGVEQRQCRVAERGRPLHERFGK